jgi:hypothetical protein
MALAPPEFCLASLISKKLAMIVYWYLDLSNIHTRIRTLDVPGRKLKLLLQPVVLPIHHHQWHKIADENDGGFGWYCQMLTLGERPSHGRLCVIPNTW